MILSDREIGVALDVGQLIIKPAPPIDAYSSTTVDLTLDSRASKWKDTSGGGTVTTFFPGSKSYKYTDVVAGFSESVDLGRGDFVLKPSHFLLGWTREYVELPPSSRLAARVEGKSSMARIGIGVHITAPTIHAGFKGQIQLEIYNHSTLHICLQPGMPICQLILEQTFGTPSAGYKGMFAGQKSA